MHIGYQETREIPSSARVQKLIVSYSSRLVREAALQDVEFQAGR
jgi:hypothetical protein